MATKRKPKTPLIVPPSLNANVMPQYGVELRIGEGPWYSTGVLCESPTQAESVGEMLAKFWLGAAENRVANLKEGTLNV